ncbi:RNA binding protein [Klebsormidium nitens]|uniref:RNA binding protein n=1 Tax=Klebsormidium nitens TaxID=105231 RepID=A0A0U9HKD7_KLENI|nr:RNA binding protein [Klebsormidium nitens]|eukprot:GAQ77624.1 RNA binding protein [Klebsormidium nitens]
MASVGTPTSDTSFAVSHSADQNGHEEVRTLFVSGLPEDVRERELYNLMRTFEGYEGSQIKRAAKSSKPVGFATFRTQAQALAVRESLNDTLFDPDIDARLQIDLAKQNSKVLKRGRPGELQQPREKKLRSAIPPLVTLPPLDSYALAAAAVGGANSPFSTPTLLQGLLGAQSVAGTSSLFANDPYAAALVSHLQQQHQHSQQARNLPFGSNFAPLNVERSPINPPCSTLFVTNLVDGTKEDELKSMFIRVPGFRKLRLVQGNGKRGPTAFVEFADTEASSQAMHQLQGIPLRFAESGGLTVQFARQQMRPSSATQF